MKQKLLNTRQLKFIKLLAQGESQAQAHRRAGYRCPTIEGHGANAVRLLKNERIQRGLQKLREKSFSEMALSAAEKRAFIARVLRSDASNPDPDLVQEYSETANEHGVSKRVKIVSKLEAINIDNKMAGDYYSDREPQATNPFTFILGLSKGLPMQQSSVDAPASPAWPALPVSPVIDADITPA